MEAHKNNVGFALCMGVSTVFGMLLAASGCVGDRGGGAATDPTEAASLRTRVHDALASNPGYQFDGVKVAVFKSTVQLSGVVDAPAQTTKAEDIAGQVAGVKEVVDRIIIYGGSGQDTAEEANDKSLAAQVSSLLNQSLNNNYEEVNVISLKGKVELSGFVSLPDQKFKAGNIARLVAGVKGLVNNITVTDSM